MGMLVTAVVLLVIGIVCFFIVLEKKKILNTFEELPKRSAADIISSGDAGAFHTARVRGKVVCDEPLKSEISETQCVFYETEVLRRYTKKVRGKNSAGHTSTKTDHRRERVAHNVRQKDFYLDDGTGKIKVSLEGAKIDKDQVVEEYKPVDTVDAAEIAFGGFRLALGAISGETTRGYEYREWVIPVDKEIMVLGGIRKGEGELCLTVPDDSRYKYIISFLDEHSFKQAVLKDAFWYKVTTVICLFFGVCALLYWLWEKGIIH